MSGLLLCTGTAITYTQLRAMVGSTRQLVATWREFPSGIAKEAVITNEQEFSQIVAKTLKGDNDLPRFYSRATA